MFLLLLTIGLDDEQKAQIEKIYLENMQLMKAIAMSYVHDEYVAEDIIQDSFFRVRNNLSKIIKFSCNERRAYLVTIVKNLCIDYCRKNSITLKNSVSLEEVSYQVRTNELSTEEMLFREEERQEAANLIHCLEPIEAKLFIDKYIYKLNYKEICKKHGIKNENTVRSTIFRIRKKLFKLYSEKGLNYEK